MKTNKARIRLVGFLISVMMISMTYLNYEEYITTYTIQDRITQGYDKAYKELMKSIYINLKADSQNKTDRLAKEIKTELISAYSDDMDTFKSDYLEPLPESELVKVIDTIINSDTNRYFHVESDANDMFVVSNIGIVSDKSQDCSVYGITRSFEDEVTMHFNKSLANQAIDSILKGQTNDVFWQFRNTRKLKKPELTTMDLDRVFDMTLEQIKDYEFLTITYIDQDQDITGRDYVSANGIAQDNNRLILVQGFNLYEQITQSKLNESFIKIEKEKHHQIDLMTEHRKGIVTKIIMSTALLISTFVTISVLLNRGDD